MSTWCLGLLFLVPCQDPPVRELVDRMRAESADIRHHAFIRLRSLGPAAEPELRIAAADADPEIAARSGMLLRILDLKRSLSPRILREFPDLPERVAADAEAWILVLQEAVATDADSRPFHPRLKVVDHQMLAREAVRQARSREDVEGVLGIINSHQLRDALPDIRLLLQNPDCSIQRSALSLLQNFRDREAVPLVAAMIEDLGMGDDAAGALSSFRRASVLPAIRGHLGHPKSWVRRNAMAVLRDGDVSLDLPTLLPLLQDPDRSNRILAMQILIRQCGAAHALPYLQPFLSDEDPTLQLQTLSALRIPCWPEAGPSLRPLLRSAHSEVRCWTIVLLTELRCYASVEDFMGLLQDPSPEVRLQAAKALAQLQIREATPDLTHLLTDPSDLVREAGLGALVELGCTEVTPLLLERLRSPDTGVRCETLAVLTDPRWRELAPEVLKLLGDPDERTRAQAFQALRSMAVQDLAKFLLPLLLKPLDPEAEAASNLLGRWNSPEIVPRLLELMAHPDIDVRRCALSILSRKAPADAAPVFLRLLADPDPEFRELAVRGASQLQLREAIPLLRKLLTDPAGAVSSQAAFALAALKDWDSLGGILNAARDDSDLIRVLRMTEDSLTPEFALPFEPFLDSDSSQVRRYTLHLLGKMKHPLSMEALRRILMIDGHPLREACIYSLGWLGDRESIPELLRFLDDPSEDLQDSAAYALSELGAREAIPTLRKRIEEDGAVARRPLLNALCRLRADGLAPLLLENLRSDYPAAVQDALREAGRIDLQEARPDLRRLSQGDDLYMRALASTTLVRLGDRDEIPEFLKGQGRELHLLNRFRRPGVYERLRTTPQSRDYRGTISQVLADLAADAGLSLQCPPFEQFLGREDCEVSPLRRRNGASTLLEALESLLGDLDATFILEQDQLILVPSDAAAPYWKLWWQQQNPK